MDGGRDQAERSTLEDGPVMESHHDALGRYTYASEEAREVIGHDAEALLGDSSADMVHEDDQAVVVDAYEAAFRTERPVVLALRILDPEGGARWVRIRFVLAHRDPPRFTAWTQRVRRPEEGQAWFRIEARNAAPKDS